MNSLNEPALKDSFASGHTKPVFDRRFPPLGSLKYDLAVGRVTNVLRQIFRLLNKFGRGRATGSRGLESEICRRRCLEILVTLPSEGRDHLLVSRDSFFDISESHGEHARGRDQVFGRHVVRLFLDQGLTENLGGTRILAL